MAAFLDGPTRMAFLALGVTLPLLMLQDSWRFAFFALGRGSQAFLNDSVWAVGLVIALVYLRYRRTLQRLLVRLRLGRCSGDRGRGRAAAGQGHTQGVRRSRVAVPPA